MTTKVAVLVGSLRKASYSRSLALALKDMAQPRLDLTLIEIGELPSYNLDLDEEGIPPAAWTRFREEMKLAEAVLFVTPEHNRSVPGFLKNAIDVGSMPYGASIWSGKPAAIISSSVGNLAGFGANHHLRQPLVYLDMPVMQQPEAYIGSVHELIDADGKIVNEDTRAFLAIYVDRFADWIERTAR